MAQPLRFHLDEHIPHAVAEGLRRRGIDVTTATDAGLLSAKDEEHLAFALTEDRVVVTNDEDYLVHHDEGVPHAGIAYCHQQSRSIGDVIRALVLMAEVFDSEEMKNHVEFI